MDIDLTATRFPKAGVLADIFSLAVNKQQPVAELLAEQFHYFSALAGQIHALQQSYTARKIAANAMDFDDLLALWLKLLREHPAIREEQQRRFQFILVDEYQDTNKLQGALIDLLAATPPQCHGGGRRLPEHLFLARRAFPEHSEVSRPPPRRQNLSRSKPTTAARRKFCAWPTPPSPPTSASFPSNWPPRAPPASSRCWSPAATASEQAAFVAQRVLQLREEGIALNKMAVLYRAHFHALELQFELTRRNIPFTITSGLRFVEQAHIKDVAAWLKFITNPRDEPAFKRIVRLLPGIGAKSADKIWSAFRAAPRAGHPPLAAALQKIAAAVPKKSAVPWAQFTATIAQLEEPETRRSASRMIHLVLEAGYEDYLQGKYTNYQSRLNDLEQMAATSLQFATVEEFLTQLALQTGVEAEDSLPAARTTRSRCAFPPFIRPRAWNSRWCSSSCSAKARSPPPAPSKPWTAKKRSAGCSTWR